MFKNYLTIAFRNLWRNKVFALINIGGLAVAMGASFIILIYVMNEMSYENCHKNKDRIYQVLEFSPDQNYYSLRTPYSLSKILPEKFLEIQKATTIKKLPAVEIQKELESIVEDFFFCADNNFFDIFTVKLVKGNKNHVLDDRNSVVISEEKAKKYFGKSDPIGKTINILTSNNNEYSLNVTGVFKEIPTNTVLKADFIGNILIAVDDRTKKSPQKIELNDWFNKYYSTFLLLGENITTKQLESKFRDFEKNYVPDFIDYDVQYSLKPLKDIYFHSEKTGFNFFPQGKLNFIYAFLIISVLILIIAAINYILLSTGISISRHKEIGIRKVVGANRQMIRRQILGESVLTVLIALPVAFILIEVFLSSANHLLDKELEIYISDFWKYFVTFILIAFFIGIFSGSYLAFYLSSLQPVSVLKGGNQTKSHKFYFRKALVVIQIIIFTGLLLCTGTIYKQLRYVLNAGLGYNKENIIKVYINPDKFKNYEGLKNEAKTCPYVKDVTGGWWLPPTYNYDGIEFPKYDNPNEEIFIGIMDVDFNFFKTFQIPVIKGRTFSEEFGTDEYAVVLNELAVKALGLSEPIGETFDEDYKIIGIVQDFHILSFHDKLLPCAFYLNEPKWMFELDVRARKGHTKEVVDYLRKTWKELAPHLPFKYKFLNNALRELYKDDERFGKILTVLTLIAVFIASLGLFGLSLLTVKTKIREIGIHKVYGASAQIIVLKILNEFFRMTLIACVIAFPVAYYVMEKWLQNFEYRTTISSWIFIACGLTAIIIVLSTVLYQSLKAANANPVDALKYE